MVRLVAGWDLTNQISLAQKAMYQRLCDLACLGTTVLACAAEAKNRHGC
jgi:hypothetical protein